MVRAAANKLGVLYAFIVLDNPANSILDMQVRGAGSWGVDAYVCVFVCAAPHAPGVEPCSVRLLACQGNNNNNNNAGLFFIF
jgi:hypothetical protein